MWDVEKHTKIENKAYLEGREDNGQIHLPRN